MSVKKSKKNLPPLPDELRDELVELSSSSFVLTARLILVFFGFSFVGFWLLVFRTRIDLENSGGDKSGKSSLATRFLTTVCRGEKTL